MKMILPICGYDLYTDPIFSALVAASIIYLIECFLRKSRNRNKFIKLEGKYDGYGYKEYDLIKDKPQSRAKIKYYKDNLLKISVSYGNKYSRSKWVGIITMELDNYGSIIWYYKIKEGQKFEDRHSFGGKKLVVREEKKKLYLYLTEIDTLNLGINKEIFVRKE